MAPPPARPDPVVPQHQPSSPRVVPAALDDQVADDAGPEAATPDGADAQADELPIGTELVRALLREQLPHWADRPLTEIRHNGTDHAMLRLGEDLVVRLPRVSWAVRTLELEQHWLPQIAPRLPVDTPVPVAVGRPAAGYPWPWTVCRWVSGRNPLVDQLTEPEGLATDLAAFVRAMHGLDPDGAPPTVWPAPLHQEDPRVRGHLRDLADPGEVDVEAVLVAWERAITARPCPRRTWIHGDLAAGNLLERGGRLCGVIDFSAMGLGDPASDLRAAWSLLPASARPTLREAVGADDDEWARAHGWALLQSVAQLAHFTDRNPWLASTARRTLAEIADEVRTGQI